MKQCIFIFFLIGYYVGSAGGVCNDESHVIRSEAECLNALEKSSVMSKYSAYLASTGNMYIGTSPNVPSGCVMKSIPINPKKPEFYSSTGLGRGHALYTPICKNPSNSGKFNQTQSNIKKF